MIVIESIGRKLKDAIDSGLKKLGKTLSEVEVEILDNGGLLFRKAKVRITVKDDNEQELTIANQIKPTKESETPKEVKPQSENRPKEVKPQGENKPKEVKPQGESRPKETKPQGENKPKEPITKKVPEVKKVAESVEPDVKDASAVAAEGELQNDQAALKKFMRTYDPITEEYATIVKDVLKELLEKMGAVSEFQATIENDGLYLELDKSLIGYHGEMLNTLELLLSAILKVKVDKYCYIQVDSCNYRQRHRERLIKYANRMAAKCLKIHRRVPLEPMNSNDRKIIHSALAKNNKIITRSEGEEPERRVVILYKRPDNRK